MTPSVRRSIVAMTMLGALTWGVTGQAGVIEERVQHHVDAAVDGGLRVTDFHQLFFALSWRGTFADWNDSERILDRFAGVRRADPLMVDELRLLRARVELERGRSAAARELFRSMGGLTSWWIARPTEIEELADFGRLAVPPASDVEWRIAGGTDPLGWVRLSGLTWPPQRQIAYLAVTIESDRDQEFALRLGAAQVARAWVNGTEVLTTPQPLERGEDQAAGGGWLRAGRNLIVIAVASENAEWWLRARITRPDGSVLAGAREIPDVPAPQRGLDRKPPAVRELGTAIRRAVENQLDGAALAYAAYLVAHRPEPVAAGGARSACRAARRENAGEARLLEWFLTSEPSAVRDLLSEAVDADPMLLWARIELAGWLGERDLFEPAFELLDGWADDDPAAAAMVLDLESALWGSVVLPKLAALGEAYPHCVRANSILADRAIEQQRWAVVEAALARLADVTPGLTATIDLDRRLAEDCGDGARLQKIFAMLLERDPGQTEARVQQARLFAAEDDLERARALLEEGLDRSPTNVDLMVELARIEHAAGEEDRSAELAQQVLAIRPQDRRAQRLLTLLGGQGEDLNWMRSPEELWALAENPPAGNPAVMVLDHREVRFLPSNLTEKRVQQAFLVTAADRADSLLVHSLPFVAEKDRLRILAARVLHPDGSETSARQGDTPRLSEPEFNLYYDTRLRILRFPELGDGDLVEIAYIEAENHESNETGPYEGGLIRLGQSVPIALAEIEMTGPPALLPQFELAHLEGEPARTIDDDGIVHLSWTWRNLAAIPTDVPASPELLTTPHMVYSNHPDWGDLADWYGRHVAPRVRVSEQVESTALDLVAGETERLDRIARIYRFVTNEIRYVGLEFGEHRFRPFSADWILQHRIGDCKDKAALLVTLLDVIDVPAHMVMVRTADLGPVTTAIGVLEVFNHAIVYLPEDDLWLDGTASGHALYPPPSIDQGATVLVVRGPESRPQISPMVGSGLESTRFRVGPVDGDVVALSIRSEDTGEAADSRRARFAGSQDPRRFARWLQSQFPGAELVGQPSTQLVPGRDPVIVEVKGTIARSALASAGGVRAFPGNVEWAASMVPGGERHGPMMVAVRPDLEWVLDVDLGGRAAKLPTTVDIDTRFGSLRITSVETKAGYRIDGFLHIEPGLLSAPDVAEFRSFLIALERHLERRAEAP